ncbi:hypothetical protein BGZ61DRAFT_520223 [Ilyonectria robusta]|uniref:uncharacterized protein n=1 Tax=Ilyonectria robusta TaxID=1079257 RepID=UPI001E8D9714|nr:uncharacterized protein BGZ61DRAFT_520223 [Ilyonectria robusta]KAH8680423.1 hypothetical protein BGZ61DRAFT_520223 [Ilyonectria robusta]
MSGFEVAGVVLGSLPLLISAMEHYRDGLDPVKAFLRYQDELNRALRDLRALHTSLAMTLEYILKQVAGQDEVIDMMSDHRQQMWKSNELETSLRSLLKDAYDDYVDILGDVESDLKVLASKLQGLDRWSGTSDELKAIIVANPPSSSNTMTRPSYEFKARLKFAMRKKKIVELIERIKKRTTELEALISKVERRGEWTTWKSSLSSSLEEISERATTLHQVLSRAWSCSSKGPHHVRLFLEHRIVRKQLRAKLGNKNSTDFGISLRTPSAPSSWHGAEVKVEEKEIYGSKMRFEEDKHADTNEIAKLEEMSNLCSIFCREAHTMDCYGLAVDSKGKLRGVYKAVNPRSHVSNRLFNLDDLLFPSPKAIMHSTLKGRSRYLLAITLASSFLQLHGTPWLSLHWDRDEIFFLEHGNEKDLRVDVEHPFVVQSYLRHHGGPNCETPSCDASMDDSSNLLTLAKLLLEIKLSYKPEFVQKGDTGDGRRMSGAVEAIGALTLSRWMKQEKDELSYAWTDAVQHCIDCSVNADTDLQDLNQRKNILNQVVMPLLEEMYSCYHQRGPLRDL